MPPAKEDCLPMTGNDLSEKNSTDNARRHILILEDEDRHAKPVQGGFGRAAGEYRITLVRTVKEAREVLERDPPDLIIADWLLPDGRGIDILPRRDGRVTTPLIIMTRHGDAKLAVQLMKSGAIDYIVKSDLTFSDLPHIAGRALREWENIQERKQAERIARESRKRLADIISFLPDATLAIDNGGNVIAWNHAIEQMTGIPAGEMMGKGDHAYGLPFYGERRPLLIDLVLADDPETEKKYDFIRRDGDRITSETFIAALNAGKGAYLWGTAAPLYDSDGNQIGAIEAIRDITDRKQVELALQEEESKYRFLVDNVRDIVWQAGPDLTFTYLSPAAEVLTGYPVGELIGRSLWDFLMEGSAADVRGRLSQRLEENARGRPVSATVFEIDIRKRDGAVLRLEVSSNPVFTAEGKFTGFSGISRDITGRRQAEAVLKESEVRFRDLFSNMSSGVAIYDATADGMDFIVRDINRAVETIEKVKKEDIIGHRVREIFPGVEDLGLLEVFRRVWKTGSPEHHPVSQYRDNRITGWRENYVYKLPSGEIVAIYEDVTEKKQAEEALRESEARYRALLDGAGIGVGYWSTEGTLLFLNGISLRRLMGKSEDFTGKNVRELFGEADGEKYLMRIRKAAVSSDPGEYEDYIHLPSGVGWYLSVYTRITDLDGTVRGIQVLSIDITGRKKMEVELKESQARLGEAIDLAHLVNWEFDVRSGIFTFNDRFYALYGTTAERESGYQMPAEIYAREFVHPDDQYLVADEVNKAVQATDPQFISQVEHRIIRCDGEVRTIVVRFGITKDENGRTVRTHGVNQDITERKRIETELKEHDMFLNRLIETLPGPLFYKDRSGKYTGCNHAFEQYVGKSKDQILGKSVFEIWPKDIADVYFARDEELFSHPGIQIYETKILFADGTRHDVIFNKATFTGAAGTIEGIVGVILDITERNKAVEAMKKSEIRFRSLIQNSSDIIRVINADGRIVYDSPSSERILGYPASTLVGKDPLDFIHPDDLERVRSDFTEVLHRKNTGTPTEFRIRKSDGSYIYVESVAMNLLDVPEINGIVVNTRPIHERKMAEISLRESEEKFRRIFDSANDGIIIVDITRYGLPGKIRDINAIQCTRLGYSRIELRNKTLSEIITPESNGKIPAFMAGLIAKGEAVFEAVFQTKNAGLLETEMSSHIIRFRDKDILIGIARDITLRRKEEQALHLANQKLQLMNIVAWHDIQNKITGLRGYVELSKDLVSDERARDFLRKEEAILKTIHASIQDTKEYQEMGTLPMQWVNIPSTIASVLARIDKRGITVSVELDDLFLYCDPVIERVFSYLVENTINYGKKATAIRMWYEESAAGLTLIYTDDGVGIPPDSKESIFLRNVARGSGFSLYFIHDILELSGMSIRECGETGKGARFEIAVPQGSYRTGAKK